MVSDGVVWWAGRACSFFRHVCCVAPRGKSSLLGLEARVLCSQSPSCLSEPMTAMEHPQSCTVLYKILTPAERDAMTAMGEGWCGTELDVCRPAEHTASTWAPIFPST